MTPIRLLAALLGAALIFAVTAGASTKMPHPHEFKKRGAHWRAGMAPGTPGPAPSAASKRSRIEVLDHHDPGGGAPAGDVVAHKDFAYLGSWGIPTEDGELCRAQGV